MGEAAKKTKGAAYPTGQPDAGYRCGEKAGDRRVVTSTLELQQEAQIHRGAIFSDCKRYRYLLTRKWGDGELLLFIMLNPSTADEKQDDPTIRRCIKYAQRWGYRNLEIVNLFALRSSHPTVMRRDPSPLGPDNPHQIFMAAQRAKVVVLAWGRLATKREKEWADALFRWLHIKDIDTFCLGRTKDGEPRHPLMLKKSAQLEPYVR